MTGYVERLMLALFATFFLVNLMLGAVVLALRPVVWRFSRRLSPGSAAGILLALRLLPAAASLLVAGAVCLPSYLRFEPRMAAENVGLPCVLAALAGAVLFLESASRTVAASIELRRFRGVCRSRLIEQMRPLRKPAQWLIQSQEPIMACAGIFRPTLIVSENLSKLLPPQQMGLAVEHERAHVRSLDNLKRLLMVCAPDLFPVTRALRALERNWAALAEWAADDSAVGGDPRMALTLAETLVRVARLGGEVRQSARLTSFFALHSPGFRQRVDRLIERTGNTRKELHIPRALPVAGAAAVIAIVATIGSNLNMLRIAHGYLEKLMRS